MGLTDLGGLSAPIAEALVAHSTGATIDLIFGSETPGLGAARRLARARPEVSLHVDPPSVAALMAEADMAIGAAGWSRRCRPTAGR